jgi:hypothetical protein
MKRRSGIWNDYDDKSSDQQDEIDDHQGYSDFTGVPARIRGVLED